MKLLKSIFYWIFKNVNLSNLLFGAQVISEFSREFGIASDEKERIELIQKLETAQRVIDSIQCARNNSKTEKDADNINDSMSKTFGDFSAKIVKDKHGKGNNGIELSLRTKINGLNTGVSYDPKNGSAKFSIGNIKLGIGN